MVSDPVERPLISVVIPTINRSDLVVRAVRSAMSQTFSRIEIIVVIDGPDPNTRDALSAVGDSRVRVVELPRVAGPGEARNIGVRSARGHWVAFLDDDDEWFGNKLELQYRHAASLFMPYPVVSCRLIRRNSRGDAVLPRRRPGTAEDISEYLLCRRTLFWGESLFQTTTVLTRRELLMKLPFRNIPFHDDLDWVIRAGSTKGVHFSFVPEPAPLAVWHADDTRERLSNQVDWKSSAAWIREAGTLITPRAYASFLLTWVSTFAARKRDYHAFIPLLRNAFQFGKPTAIGVAVWFYNWLAPPALQRMISLAFSPDGALTKDRRKQPLSDEFRNETIGCSYENDRF